MLNSISRVVITLGLASVFLHGCKRGEPPPPKAQASEQAESAKPQPQGADLFKTQRDALDRAKALEGQMQQRTNDQAKAIEAAQK